ncbi:hypothetical protein ACQP0C_17130 [Nocardia sp. CA-129566]|uniref:hypothetical protein n=1 Tax=Nocardia sp. CA-129566 TaxID=3239976 RepID=UPI003D96C790
MYLARLRGLSTAAAKRHAAELLRACGLHSRRARPTAEGTASWWEPLIALARMAAATYGIVVIAEKIYRRSLMQTQGRLTIRQALRVQD